MRARRSERRRRRHPVGVDAALPEFLDELLDVAPWRPRPRDAWRRGRHADTTFEITVTVLGQLANPTRIRDISRDVDRLTWVRESMVDRGIDQPLILVVDHAGRVTLRDGHHRYLGAVALGWVSLPARLEVSERIRSHGIPVHEVLAGLMNG